MIDYWKSGSGNALCHIDKETRVQLNNEPVSLTKADAFVYHICREWNEALIEVIYREQTTSIWGRAWRERRMVTLFRQSVWVLLHELAHILKVREGRPHGKNFGTCLDELYLAWCKFGG